MTRRNDSAKAKDFSAEKPEGSTPASELIKAGFYNVGWQDTRITGKKFKSLHHPALTDDVQRAFRFHALDVLAISEWGSIGKGLETALRTLYRDIGAFKSATERFFLEMVQPLSAEKPGGSFEVYHFSHYVFIVSLRRVRVRRVQEVLNLDPIQSWRNAHLIRLELLTCQGLPEICIVNNHSPTPQGLSATTRLNIVAKVVEAAGGRRDGNTWARCIWGGDFNMGEISMKDAFHNYDANVYGQSLAAEHRRMQLVCGHPLRRRHGDLAVMQNLLAVHEDTTIGKSYDGTSDSHDLVIACGLVILDEGVPDASSSSSNPRTPLLTPRTISSAAKPAAQSEDAGDPQNDHDSSAAKPAAQSSADSADDDADDDDAADDDESRDPSGASSARTSPTPLADALLQAFADQECQSDDTADICSELGLVLWHGSLAVDNAKWPATIPPRQNLEVLLQTVQAQRTLFIDILLRSGDERVIDATQHGSIEFSEDDMKNLHNRWMNAVEEWMPRDVLQHYRDLRKAAEQKKVDAKASKDRSWSWSSRNWSSSSWSQTDWHSSRSWSRPWQDESWKDWSREGEQPSAAKPGGSGREGEQPSAAKPGGSGAQAQDLKKKTFNVHCFKLSGCKHVLFTLIRYPSYCTAAGLKSLLQTWSSYKDSPEGRKARQDAEKKSKAQEALKQAAHQARKACARGARLNRELSANLVSLQHLSQQDQKLVDDFASGALKIAQERADEAYGHDASTRFPGGSVQIAK